MSESNADDFVVECSDDESYANNEDNYRSVNGKRVWEPNGPVIGQLYRQLEAKGFIELQWQCPGRRSPSVHNIGAGLNDRQKCESTDNEMTCCDTKSATMSESMNEFDFETDSHITSVASKATLSQRRRSNHGMKTSQTDLTKVMADIKKYKIIDQSEQSSK